jgi:hypothetical protein
MSLKLPGVKLVPVSGSGPNGRVELTDIRSKLGEIRGEVDETAEQARPMAWYAGVGGVVLLVILAFVLGRRRGQRKASWVEIRRL